MFSNGYKSHTAHHRRTPAVPSGVGMAVGDRLATPDPAGAARGALGAAHARCGELWAPGRPIARREGRLKAALAAPAGADSGGGGSGGGSGDARDAGGRAAAGGALRDAHSRTCGHKQATHGREKRTG